MFQRYQWGLLWIVLLVCLLAKQAQAHSDWSQGTRDYIVQIHNDRRAAEGGCHINKIIYDEELERQAKQWALGCWFNHENKPDRGENLAWSTNKNEEKELIKTASDSWFNEKLTYSYGQHSCGNTRSCHYTQMVWWNTVRIGCYSTRCGYLTGGAANAWYFVCFYTPKGNLNGERPYQKGCKTQCREGQTEEIGLCVGEAKGGSGNGGECVDKQGNCKTWARVGQCTANPNYMKVQCQKTCEICKSTETGGPCEDSSPLCSNWEKNGECQRNPTYMNGNCPKSCEAC